MYHVDSPSYLKILLFSGIKKPAAESSGAGSTERSDVRTSGRTLPGITEAEAMQTPASLTGGAIAWLW
jgi:hypothetical protein